MLKKKILFVIFIFLTSCGYQSVYVKNDSNFFIKEIKLEGDKRIGKTISSQIKIEKDVINKIPYIINLNSKKFVEITSKDSLGNPSLYKITINIQAILERNKIKIKEKNFNKTFTYNSIENKFDQSQYQKSIEQNLINKIAEELIIFLYY
tara:strand:+ start:393 stop:842 length:450 start_codon:yes stop_codon:yes gene_type:complete